ncbi:MAG TPA: 4Fe-4S dicluster domain-containing protein [Terriglobales bacterium]|nr:4Fe-4S dicluster domain-containing protein [Terriglobales bacterium]
MATNKKALLIDITKCIGCQACAGACKEAHGVTGDPEPKLSETALTVVQDKNGKFVRKQCLHCEQPACGSACLVGAITKTAAGPVVYDKSKCVGCRYCMIACPHSVPRYEWSKLAPYMKKCDMCYDKRVSKGQPTACAEACPVGATIFGDRDEMLREARRRILDDPKYVPHIYGEREYGGASMLFLSDVEFEKLGFMIPPTEAPLPEVSKAALDEAPMVVLVGGTMLAGLYWITNRRREVLLAEAQKKTLKFPVGDEEERS